MSAGLNLLDANDRPGAYPGSWYAATAEPLAPFAALRGARRADVCVIGGGYTGLSAALTLAEAGMDVVLLEAQRVGFGASGRNGGQVGSGQRIEQGPLEKLMGPGDARLLWEMGEAAKARVRHLIEAHGIDAQWQDGVVHAAWHRSDAAHAHAEARHLAEAYGYDQIECLDNAAMHALVGAPGYKGGTVDWGAGHLHPLRFALGLARAAAKAGAQIAEQSRVLRIAGNRVETASGHVEADHIILACNGYLGDLVPQVAHRVMPINNFIVATEPLDDPTQVLAKPVAVADTRFVVNYYRLSPDNRMLFGGGESYGYRFPADIAALVRRPMVETFPQLRDIRIDYAWGGTLAITMERLPYFARIGPILNASGFSGHGVAMATLAGEILAQTIRGQAERFDLLSRLPVPAFPGGSRFRTPLLILAMTWFALRDRLGI